MFRTLRVLKVFNISVHLKESPMSQKEKKKEWSLIVDLFYFNDRRRVFPKGLDTTLLLARIDLWQLFLI